MYDPTVFLQVPFPHGYCSHSSTSARRDKLHVRTGFTRYCLYTITTVVVENASHSSIYICKYIMSILYPELQRLLTKFCKHPFLKGTEVHCLLLCVTVISGVSWGSGSYWDFILPVLQNFALSKWVTFPNNLLRSSD